MDRGAQRGRGADAGVGTLIKQHRPRFNIRLRDDKSYPFLAVTLRRAVPGALVMRGRKRKGTRYFGPYCPRLRHPRHARPAAAQLPHPHLQPRQVQRAPAAAVGRACCSTSRSAAGPCVGEIEEMPYRQLVTELCEFLDGNTDDIVKRLETR